MRRAAPASLASLVFASLVFAAACSAPPQDSARTAPHADEGPAAYFVNLKDGDVVASPFRVVFGLYGLGVAPAGVAVENTAHHHILIDATLGADDLAYPVPADDNHIHFGGGQTETVLDLAPGAHTLQLVPGDANHVPLDPSIWSDRITITVE
ncbi:MAG: DUF4399 domain-containing protein [Parvularculaceae bacterium]